MKRSNFSGRSVSGGWQAARAAREDYQPREICLQIK